MAVYIKSPMAMLDVKLSILSVTFTQDRQNGSRTTLELVRPFRNKQYDEAPGAPSTKADTGDKPPPNQPVPEALPQE
jgi:hypothetical protein